VQRIAITVRPNSRQETFEQQGVRSWLVPWTPGGMLQGWVQDEVRTSPVEQLLEQTQAHIAEHDGWLEECGRLQDELDDPAAQFVTQQLVDSRMAHRRLLAGMAASLRDSLYWTESEGALPCPPPAVDQAPAHPGLRRVNELIRAERDLARTSRQLARAYGNIAGGLDAMLLQVIAVDSTKHYRVLGFLRRLLQSHMGPARSPERGGVDEAVVEPSLREAAEPVREPVRVPAAARMPANYS
jgi:hypothetical protein